MFYTIYYLPIWFQAVQGVSAVQSGIRNLPLILSMTVGSIICGGLVTAWGYYVPFMIGGSAICTVGMGLITTFQPNASRGMWIGYQVLMGFGIGSAMQQGLLAVQTVLPIKDIPTGTALIIFAQTLGGAIAITIGQSIFSKQLIKNILKYAPGIDPAAVVNLGASHIQKGVPPQFIKGIIQAYNDAITTAFYVAVAFGVVGTIAACGMEWRSVKKPVSQVKKDIESSGASESEKENNEKKDDVEDKTTTVSEEKSVMAEEKGEEKEEKS
jgi:MFS family permease